MTSKEKEIYERIKSATYGTGFVSYSSALKCLKEYKYEDKKKIIDGMRKRGYIRYITRNGYITNIELIEQQEEKSINYAVYDSFGNKLVCFEKESERMEWLERYAYFSGIHWIVYDLSSFPYKVTSRTLYLDEE